MARDGKLREVLDSLSDEPARTLPRHDRELMESVLRRLRIQEARRPAPYDADARTVDELESERDEASRRLEELESLRHQHDQEQEALQRLAAERDALLEHQRELEDRLASLEASSHGGPLSYVEEGDEVVEFARVDLGQSGDMLEFQYLGSDEEAGFEAPDQDAWQDGENPRVAPDWDDGAAWQDEAPAGVQWDDEESDADAAPWQGGDEAWPAEPEAGAGEEAAPWDESDDEPDNPFAADDEPADRWQEPAPEVELDERTQNELADLEKQLAELEREIEEREKREKGGKA